MKKKFILGIVCALGFLSSNAQIQLGVTGGADYTTMNVRSEFQNVLGVKGTSSYHFGIASKYSVNENVCLAADLLFAKKGFQQSDRQYGTDSLTNFDVSLYYIELPVLMEFKVKFKKMNVLFGIGPYVSYGIGGNVKLDITSPSTNLSYTEKIRWDKYNSDPTNVGESIVYDYGYSKIKRLDYGVVTRFGIEFNSFILSAEYKYGIANLMWEFRKYERMNNQSIGLSLVYLLKAKKQHSHARKVPNR